MAQPIGIKACLISLVSAYSVENGSVGEPLPLHDLSFSIFHPWFCQFLVLLANKLTYKHRQQAKELINE